MAEDLRLRDNHIQTAVAELAHPNTGGTVGIIAALHLGMPSYYAQLGGYIAAREAAGAAVHFEGVRHATSNAAAASLQNGDTKTHSLLTRSPGLKESRLYSFIMRELDLISQRDGLQYPATWQNHDFNSIQVVQHEQGRAFVRESVWPMRIVDGITRVVDTVTPRPFKPHIAGFLFKSLMFGESSDRVATRAVSAAREEVAMEAVQTELSAQPDRDIVMIWGGGHMEAFIENFDGLGYEPTDIQWIDAVHLPGNHEDIG